MSPSKPLSRNAIAACVPHSPAPTTTIRCASVAGSAEVDMDLPVLDPHRVGAQVDGDRRAHCLAVRDAESPVVLRALDDAVHDQTIAQQHLLVRAVPVAGVELVVLVAVDGDVTPVDGDADDVLLLDVVD